MIKEKKIKAFDINSSKEGYNFARGLCEWQRHKDLYEILLNKLTKGYYLYLVLLFPMPFCHVPRIILVGLKIQKQQLGW